MAESLSEKKAVVTEKDGRYTVEVTGLVGVPWDIIDSFGDRSISFGSSASKKTATFNCPDSVAYEKLKAALLARGFTILEPAAPVVV